MSATASFLDHGSCQRPAVFDVDAVRVQFPILRKTVHGRPLVYLDNAATSQKPQAVIDAILRFYTSDCSNIHRGVHLLAERATADYESARAKVQRFIGARHAHEVVFVRGTTEAINLVAQSFGRQRVQAGDEILVSAMEHHSNIIPWQMLCRAQGSILRVVPVDDAGELMLGEYERLLSPKTRLVAVTHASNVLGTVAPLAEIIAMAHRRNVPVLVDGAQAVPHFPVDVERLDCDFYAFSGHKLYGPTGIGVLYGKAELLDSMPPYQGGGGMIRSVAFEETVYDRPPQRFEAGTPDIAGAIGLGAAVDFVDQVGLDLIAAHEQSLLSYATQSLSAVPGIRLIGTAGQKVAILSFVLDGVHPHDVGTILDHQGIATRTGHHCAQPLMERFQVPATTRASLALYNTREEIDALIQGLHKVSEVLR
ncbi:MAG: cysteine sulfinate desulfinase [Planctomycetes bacterium RBG_16_64_12]|nr:MAG: cysteine sulfinate desulfinase [Planctomycetes bacterium RBG_16_64_12]